MGCIWVKAATRKIVYKSKGSFEIGSDLMQYIQPIPNPSGAYPAPQSTPFPDGLPLADSQAETLVQYNGFVTITQEPDDDIADSSVTVTPDVEAWEAWKAEQPPEPNPTEPEQFATYNELASAIKSGVNNIL